MQWPFKKSTDQNLPPEVQDYYRAEQRERRGLAWLLALGTLLVTVAVALGLFYGGRLAYRKIVSKAVKPPTTQTATNQPSKATNNATQPSGAGTPGAGSPAPTSSNSTPSNPNNSSPAVTPNNSQATVPNTGPGDTLAVFLAVTILSALAHRIYTLRKLS